MMRLRRSRFVIQSTLLNQPSPPVELHVILHVRRHMLEERQTQFPVRCIPPWQVSSCMPLLTESEMRITSQCQEVTVVFTCQCRQAWLSSVCQEPVRSHFVCIGRFRSGENSYLAYEAAGLVVSSCESPRQQMVISRYSSGLF